VYEFISMVLAGWRDGGMAGWPGWETSGAKMRWPDDRRMAGGTMGRGRRGGTRGFSKNFGGPNI
jgi:hypothetical protein